jgi:hypothetical protein
MISAARLLTGRASYFLGLLSTAPYSLERVVAHHGLLHRRVQFVSLNMFFEVPCVCLKIQTAARRWRYCLVKTEQQFGCYLRPLWLWERWCWLGIDSNNEVEELCRLWCRMNNSSRDCPALSQVHNQVISCSWFGINYQIVQSILLRRVLIPLPKRKGYERLRGLE